MYRKSITLQITVMHSMNHCMDEAIHGMPGDSAVDSQRLYRYWAGGKSLCCSTINSLLITPVWPWWGLGMKGSMVSMVGFGYEGQHVSAR
jgi:hypothetical protein